MSWLGVLVVWHSDGGGPSHEMAPQHPSASSNILPIYDVYSINWWLIKEDYWISSYYFRSSLRLTDKSLQKSNTWNPQDILHAEMDVAILQKLMQCHLSTTVHIIAVELLSQTIAWRCSFFFNVVSSKVVVDICHSTGSMQVFCMMQLGRVWF